MADLDETSLLIGEMKQTLKQHGDAHVVIIEGQKQIIERLTMLNGSVAKAHTRLDDAAPALAAANDYAENKKHAKWWLGGMAAAGLGGGFSVTAWLDSAREFIAHLTQ